MPSLPRTYTAELGGSAISGGRRASGDDFAPANFGAAAAGLSKAAEGVLQAKEEDESRQVLVKQAEIRAKYSKRLDEAVTSGEDVAKIRQDLDNDLSAVTETLATKKGADTAALHAANTGAIFDSEANRIEVTRATVKARVEGGQFLNSTGAILSTNPGYLPQAEKDVDAFVSTLSKVPPDKRAEIAENLKQNLNVAAAMSNARIDPEGTKRAVEGGAYNMDPQQRLQVIHQADATIRAKRSDEAYERAQKDYQKREADDAARDGWFKKIMGGGAKAIDIINDPALSPQSREHLVMFQEQRTKALAAGDRKSDPNVFKDLYLRATAPDGTEGKIYGTDAIFEAVKNGKLNTTDAERLRGIVFAQKDENGRTIGTRLNGMTTGFGRDLANDIKVQSLAQADPGLASEIQNTYVARVMQRVEDLRKAGTSPNEVFNPDSKSYVGSREFKQGVINEVMGQKAPAVLDAAVKAGQMQFPDGSLRQWNGKEPKTNPANWTVVESAMVRQIPK